MSDSKAEAKAVVQRMFEAMSAWDVEGAAACVAEGLVNHAAVPESQGRAGMRNVVRKLAAAFPDAKHTLEDMIAEGDRVVTRVVVSGTHTGPLDFAKMPLPATGRSFRSEQIHIHRVENGLITEHWSCRDDLAMLTQLGLFNPKAAA